MTTKTLKRIEALLALACLFAPLAILGGTALAQSFATPVNDVAMALGAPHAPGDGKLIVQPGQGAKVGSSFPVRLTGIRAGTTSKVRFLCTARLGDTLSVTPITTGPDATTDIALAAGDAIEGRITAGAILELQTAILAGGGGVDPTAMHLAGTETVTGQKSFSLPITGTISGAITEGQVTNLTADLAAKAADASVIHNTGNETGLAGNKTFTQTITAAQFVGGGGGLTGVGSSSAFGPRTDSLIGTGILDPGNITPADNALLTQAAFDALVDPTALANGTQNVQSGAVLRIPSGSYAHFSPVFIDADYVKLQGEGVASILESYNINSPPLVVGIKRKEPWKIGNGDPFCYGVTNKVLSSNVATLTVTGHPFAVGQTVAVAGVDPVFNGTFTVTAPVTSSTFSYGVTHADIGSTAVSPAGKAGLPIDFATSHRQSLDGQFADSSCTGRGLYSLASRMPNTAWSGRADHFLHFWGIPPQTGGHDYWNGDASQKFTLQFAIQGGGGGAIGAGPIMGMGGLTALNPSQVSPWILTAGTWDHNTSVGDAAQYHFYFTTDTGGNTTQATGPAGRYFSFGDITKTGWQHITLYIDFTTNDGSGCCTIAAWQSATPGALGTQVAVTRLFGTGRTTNLGTPGTGGYEPRFVAADNLHYARNELYPFTVFAQALSSRYPLGGNTVAGSGNGVVPGITDATLGGLRMDLGTCPISNGGVGTTEHLSSGGASPTFYQKYFDTTVSPSTRLCHLPLSDPPHDAAKNSDRLITVNFGTAAQGGFYGHGWYAYDEQDNSGQDVVTDTQLRDLTVSTGLTYGNAVTYGNAFMHRAFDVQANGGWHGLSMQCGGYDYNLRNCTLRGGDAALYMTNGLGRLENPARVAVGTTLVRANDSDLRITNAKMGDYNSFGMTTDAYYKFHGQGSYGGTYIVDGLELDQEGPPAPKTAVIWCERTQGRFQTYLKVNHVEATNLGGKPVIFLSDGASGWTYNVSGYGFADIANILHSDGLLLQTDGPNWLGDLRDSPCLSDFLENFEPVRNSGAGNIGNVCAHWAAPTLPPYGRFAAGSCEVTIRNAAPSGVRTYLCTGSGCAAWSSAWTYHGGNLVNVGGVEYAATAAAGNTNQTPPNATFWTPGATAPAVVWKAISTVAP